MSDLPSGELLMKSLFAMETSERVRYKIGGGGGKLLFSGAKQQRYKIQDTRYKIGWRPSVCFIGGVLRKPWVFDAVSGVR